MNAFRFAIFFVAISLHLTAARAQFVSNSEPGADHLRSQLSVIAQQRAHLLGLRAREDSACSERFAVNDCRAAVRERYRAALADLDRQELLLNDQDRRARAALRLQALEDKAARGHEVRDGVAPVLPDGQVFDPTPADLRAPLVPEIQDLPRTDGGSSGGLADIQAAPSSKPEGRIPAARASALEDRRQRAQTQAAKRKGQSLPAPATGATAPGSQP